MLDIKNYRDRSCELVNQLKESDDLFLERTLELWSLGNKILKEIINSHKADLEKAYDDILATHSNA